MPQTAQSIYRQFWHFALPTIAAMIVSGLYQVVDGIFIGHYIGAQGLAGINLAWPMVGAIYGIGMLVGIGTGAKSSIKLGEKKLNEAKVTLSTGLLMLLLVAPIISVLLFFFSNDFLALQGANGESFIFATQYLQVLLFANPFALGSIAIPFLLRNDGSPNFATLLMVIGAITNIGFDYIFIAHFSWGLKGAAIATSIAQCIVCVVGIGYFFSAKANMRLSRASLRVNFADITGIIAIGASSFFMYVYGAFMVAVHNKLFAQYGDPTLVGAYAILGYIFFSYYLFSEGVANAMQPLVSFNHGAGKPENIRKLLSVAMCCTIFGGIAFVGLLNTFPERFIAIFNSQDKVLMEYAVAGIRLHLFALFLDGFLVVAAAYYQSINRGSKATFVTVGNMLVQLPFLYFMPKLIGVTGIWLSYPLSNIALSLVVIFMFYFDIKNKLSPDALDESL